MATTLRGARFVALDFMLACARRGEHESAGANRSPLIDKINKNAGVPVGSSYCAAAVKYAFKQAGIDDFGGQRAASVGYEEQWARDHGYLVTRPQAGDAFCWKIDGDDWPDHAGMVERVRSWGGLLFTIDTVEANTSSGNVGSQANGGGWFRRRRTFTRGRVSFVRDPVRAKKDPYAASAAKKIFVHLDGKAVASAISKLPVLKKGAHGNSVKVLQRKLKKAGAKVVVDGVFGPSTLNSVRAFQKRQGLKADGVVGSKTWAKLAKIKAA